jgi:hypothetical protein
LQIPDGIGGAPQAALIWRCPMLRAIRQSIRAMKNLPIFFALGCLVFIHCAGGAQAKPRARDLGVPFDGTTGQFNAITDVKGVEVGHTTLISGSGKLKVGTGPVRTG